MTRLTLGLLFFVASSANCDEPPKIKRERNVVYAKTLDKVMKLDLAMPATGEGPLPAVVCIHGGAWRLGSRTDMSKPNILWNNKAFTDELAAHGYVAVSISYRLIHDAPFPAMIEDCQTAVRWLRENAKRYNIDPDHIGVTGFSAGGHLAALVGLAADEPKLRGPLCPKEKSNVQCVVDFYGPADLTKYLTDESSMRAVFEPMIGGPVKDRAELWKAVSPINHVRKGAPPFLILHGTDDHLVSIDHSRELAAKLEKAGAEVKLVELEGYDHGWIGRESQKTMDMAIAFFDRHLKPKK